MLSDIRIKLDTLEEQITEELNNQGSTMVANLLSLKDIEETLAAIHTDVTNITDQVTQLTFQSDENAQAIQSYKEELKQITEMIKLGHSVKQLLINKAAAKACLDEGDFQNAAAFLGNAMVSKDLFGQAPLLDEFFKEIADMCQAVQKVLNNSSNKPRHSD